MSANTISVRCFDGVNMEVIYKLKKILFSYDVLEMDNKRIKKK